MATPNATRFADASAWRAGSDTLRVLQFTDLHLYSNPNQTLYGRSTRETCREVIDWAKTHHWPPDAVVLTGDLVHDERVEGYRYLRQLIESLGVPCFCIPGNHDSTSLLAAEVDPRAAQHCRIERLGAWDLVLLDSTIAGSEGGRLATESLTALETYLGSGNERPAMVCLHHQPVAVGSRWLDTMQIENGDALIALADKHNRLRAILWGHVHQTYDHTRGDTRLLATPSTCAQFAPGLPEFALDDKPPGYRWLELASDGSLRTGIEWVSELP